MVKCLKTIYTDGIDTGVIDAVFEESTGNRKNMSQFSHIDNLT